MAPTAKISFAETSFDFGEIKQGEKVSHTFAFTNTGEAPLTISKVNTTCGCTAPYWPKQPVPPGATDKIEVTFNSAGKSGMQRKNITILSNAAASPTQLTITAMVKGW